MGTATAADISGQNHPAATSGSVTLGVAGGLASDSNTAATLDGSTGFLHTSSAVTVGSDFSIEAWVKPNTATASGTIVSLMNGAYMSPLFHTGTGHAMIIAGLVMMGIGSLMLKKIVSFRG